MAILRQLNVLGQARVDVPHLRALESSICADVDLIAGTIMAGSKPLVIAGFDIVTTGAVGNPATSLQLNVANGVILHPTASESGSIFAVATDAAAETLNAINTSITGSFTANQTNYIGLDLSRTADDSTADVVQFLDSSSLTETPKIVDLARTLKYRIVISTIDFASTPNLLPIAIVAVNTNGLVNTLTDARQMMFRLGSGGTSPNVAHAYPWASGRAESTTNTVFSGGDKQIGSMKDWADAIMTSIWEIKGGSYWYSPTSLNSNRLTRGPLTFTNGEQFEWTGTNLHWKNLRFVFGNGTVYYNDIPDQITDNAGQTDLADGQCLYVDINFGSSTSAVPAKGTLITLGSPTIPGSRYVLAWRTNNQIYTRDGQYAVGTTFKAATNISTGAVQLNLEPNAAWLNYPAGVVPIVNQKSAGSILGSILGAGISRGDTDAGVGAGTLLIGGGAQDTSIQLGTAGTTTAVDIPAAILKADAITSHTPSGVVVLGTSITPAIDVAAAALKADVLSSHSANGTISYSGTLLASQTNPDHVFTPGASRSDTTSSIWEIRNFNAGGWTLASTLVKVGYDGNIHVAPGAGLDSTATGNLFIGRTLQNLLTLGRVGAPTTINSSLMTLVGDQAPGSATPDVTITSAQTRNAGDKILEVENGFSAGVVDIYGNGDIATAGDFKYSGSKFGRFLIHADQMVNVDAKATLSARTSVSDETYWSNNSTGVGSSFAVGGRGKLPPGATLTSFFIWYSLSGAVADITPTYIVYHFLSSSGTLIQHLVVNSSGGVIFNHASGTSIFITGGPTLSEVVAADEWVRITISTGDLPAGVSLKIYTIDVSYSMSTLLPGQ